MKPRRLAWKRGFAESLPTPPDRGVCSASVSRHRRITKQRCLDLMNDSATHQRSNLRIGARGSRLARWQAEWVADRLRGSHPGLTVEIVEIKTHGDRDRNSPLAAIGGTGLFTKEIQRAVLDRAVDVAVHSLKDLPTQGPEELTLAAVP